MSGPSALHGGIRLALDDGPAVDPFALAGAAGMVFCAGERVRVGLGRALAIELPDGLEEAADLSRAVVTLAGIAVDDRLQGRGEAFGAPVVAFASLPFDRRKASVLVVPELLYGRDGDGVEWVTVLRGGSGGEVGWPPTTGPGLRDWLVSRSGDGAAPTGTGRAGAGPRIQPCTSDESFLAMVGDALRVIDRGELAKVVLARQVQVSMPGTIDVVDLLTRWGELEPACALFSLPTSDGLFVGASPELLVEREGDRVRSRPLAGTSERSPYAEGGRTGGEDRLGGGLLSSQKDGNEHRLVVEAIEEALGPLCSELHVPDGPDLVHLRSITHLGTSITGTLAPDPARTTGGPPTALDLVAALHPTPAVGGVPRQRAIDLLSHLEVDDRGHYAGPVGYVDSAGDGTWMVGIRAMSIRGADARLAAGVGIVAGSDPRSELAETELKLTAVLAALAPDVPLPLGRRDRAVS